MGPKGDLPKTAQKNDFFIRSATRNREAIEAKKTERREKEQRLENT